MPHCIISPSSPEMFSPRVAEKELTRLFRREYIYYIKIEKKLSQVETKGALRPFKYGL